MPDLPTSGLNRWFLTAGVPPSLQVEGFYNPWLVALSVLVAVAASWAALQLAGQAREARGRTNRFIALGAGAGALGAGVWAMHFIGMLAFKLCADVDYSPGITLASMLPSLAASGIALSLLSRRHISAGQLVVGGTLVGAGIGAMHYGGMLAMRMSPRLVFDPLWFTASIVVAVALAILSLWIRYGLLQRVRMPELLANALAGLVMGLAITGMHYTGMGAARFVGITDPAFDPALAPQDTLALGIAFVALTIGVVAVGALSLLRFYQLNQQLRESEGRLRAVVDTAVDGIISIDQHGLVQSFNASAERIFGMHADEIVGSNVNRLMTIGNSEARESDFGGLHGVGGLGKIIGSGREVVGRRRDGTPIPLRLAVSQTEVKGEPVFFGIVTDISARKAIERELRHRETQYRTLIANMPGVAFRSEAGLQTRLLFVSDRIEELTGWPAEDFIEERQSYDALVQPDDCKRAQDIMAVALAQDQPYAIEYRITRRDGQERWISETAGGGRDTDGQLRWIDGVMRDVTEDRLRNKTFETAATVLDRAMAVMEIDPDGRIVHCNAKYVAMMGYTHADEVLGRFYDEMMPVGQRDLLQALRRGEVQEGEFERVGKDGRILWVQATYNPVFDEAGQLVKMMAFKTDVTERKHMESELREAKARAEQAAAARSSFLANMSHEIRTPMNAILGFTDVLLNTTLAPTQRRHMDTVRQAAQSLLGLLNDILDTAKLEKGAVELEVADFSLRALCEQVTASMRLTAEKKRLRLELDYPADVPEHYRGDALRIQQVLVNLVGNAIKFTQQGRVDIEVRRQAGCTVIGVVDTGIGIAPDRVERIFDAFAQADATITRKFGGTGLGTTIARQLTELMGGRIVVQSTLGVGSRFEMRLPLSTGHAPASSHADAVARLPALTVLVADDVPQNIELLELVLQADGHQVHSARNGREAVERFGQQRFDLVLMDMHMPEMDGLAATRAVRALEREEGRVPTPVIALTASVQAADRHAALQAGMDGFATKPVVTSQLFGEIARVLGLQTPPPPEHAAAAVGGIVDWPRGLQLWHKAERLHKAIASFLAAETDTAGRLRTLAEQQDHAGLAALAHRVSGAAGNLALPDLRNSAQGLERAARSQDGQGVDAGVRAVAVALAAVVSAFPQGEPVADHNPPAPAVTDRATLLAMLARLEHALAGSTLDEDALRLLGDALPPDTLRELLEAVDSFDFARAAQCVQSLRDSLDPTALQAT